MKYNINTGIKNAKRKISMAAFGLAALVFPAIIAISSGAVSAVSNSYNLFGNAQIVSPGHNSPHAVQLSSTCPSGYPACLSDNSLTYSGIDFTVTGGMTLNNLNNLATDYMFTSGSCGGGSPRFQVNVTNGTNTGNIQVYIGPPPSYTGCPLGVWSNTGNVVTPASLVDTSQLPGGTFYDPYSSALVKYGSYQVTGIQLVADGGWAVAGNNQTVLIDNTQINNVTYTYDQPQNKDECKNGGWQTLQDSNGNSFKNQGDCVSFVATGGKNLASSH